MNRRAILYARVSTDEQSENGYSLQTQLEAMREYAEKSGLTVVGELQEEHSGHTRLSERPRGAELQAKLERREADSVIVYTVDRLSRNLAHSLVLREEWSRAGIELHTVDRGQFQNTPEARLTHNVEAVIAEYEREKIRERTRRGRYAKAKSGKWVGAGPVPYGYHRVGRKQDAQLLIDPETSEVVRRIFGMYAGRNGYKPATTYEIAETLTREGITPPKSKICWYPEAVKRVIDNETYIGVLYYGHFPVVQSTAGTSKQVKRPKNQCIRIEIPELAIIDLETYKAAQARRRKNQELSSRNRKRDYLLSGFLRCSCGTAMSGWARWGSKKADGSGKWLSLRYKCCHQSDNRKFIYGCTETYLPAELVDGLVWDWISALLKDPIQLQAGIRRMAEREELEIAPKRERLSLVEDLCEKTDRKLKRLTTAFAEAESDDLADALRGEMRTVSRQLEALRSEMEALMVELAQAPLNANVEQTLLNKAQELMAEMTQADFATKRYFLDRLNFNAILRRDELGLWLDCKCGIALESFILQTKPSPSDKPNEGGSAPNSSKPRTRVKRQDFIEKSSGSQTFSSNTHSIEKLSHADIGPSIPPPRARVSKCLCRVRYLAQRTNPARHPPRVAHWWCQ